MREFFCINHWLTAINPFVTAGHYAKLQVIYQKHSDIRDHTPTIPVELFGC